MGFGDKIRKLRDEKNMSIRELAGKAGMDFTLLSKIEHGIRPAPEVHFIFALADALGIEDPVLLEELMSVATESQEKTGQRLTEEQLERFRTSPSHRVFMRLKPRGGGGKSK